MKIIRKKELKKILERLERDWNRIEDELEKIVGDENRIDEINMLCGIQQGLLRAMAYVRVELGIPVAVEELMMTSDINDII